MKHSGLYVMCIFVLLTLRLLMLYTDPIDDVLLGTKTSAAIVYTPPLLVPMISVVEQPASRQQQKQQQRYVMPRFVSSGVNNFKMEIRRAALLAKELNRFLCIPSLTPSKIASGLKRKRTLHLEDLYDVHKLNQFVPILPEHICSSHLNDSIILDCSKDDLAPSNLTRIENTSLIVLTGCLFPQRPYTDDAILWQYLLPPESVRDEATRVIATSSLIQNNFTSFHWRFEEAKCAKKKALGLCFRHSSFLFHSDTNRSSTLVATEQEIATVVIAAAVAEASNHQHPATIFLATDGRLRGFGEAVDRVKALVQNHGIPIYELEDLFGKNASSRRVWTSRPFYRNEVEQAICRLSARHIGSSMSSWDWEVFLSMATMRGDNNMQFRLFHSFESKKQTSCSGLSDGLNGLLLQRQPKTSFFDILDVDLYLLRERGYESYISTTLDIHTSQQLLSNLSIRTSCHLGDGQE